MKRKLLAILLLSATSLAAAQPIATQPAVISVQAGFVPIADGSYHVVILANDQAASDYCGAEWKAGLLQAEFEDPTPPKRGPLTNPSGCWTNTGSGTVSFKYFDFMTGAVRQFTIPKASLRPMRYGWRTQRLYPIAEH